MLLVKTVVKESTIPGAGKGLFADEFIAAGTLVWRVDTGVDKIIPDIEVQNYSAQQRQEFAFHAFQSNITTDWIACFDGAQYVNHGDTPNLKQEKIGDDVEFSDVAVRDIWPGEELLDNYFDYDLDAERKLN